MCRLCGERVENVSDIQQTTECNYLAQKQYKYWRHDQVAKVVLWKLCQNNDLQSNKTWYMIIDPTEVAMVNDQVKLLWAFKTDHLLDHNRPYIVVLEKASRVCQIIDVACPLIPELQKKRRLTTTRT